MQYSSILTRCSCPFLCLFAPDRQSDDALKTHADALIPCEYGAAKDKKKAPLSGGDIRKHLCERIGVV